MAMAPRTRWRCFQMLSPAEMPWRSSISGSAGRWKREMAKASENRRAAIPRYGSWTEEAPTGAPAPERMMRPPKAGAIVVDRKSTRPLCRSDGEGQREQKGGDPEVRELDGRGANGSASAGEDDEAAQGGSDSGSQRIEGLRQVEAAEIGRA